MTAVAGYIFFSLCSLYAMNFFLTACDDYAALLMEASMPNSSITPLVAFQVRNNKNPRYNVVVESAGRFEVRCTDGRVIKCHNLATARAVRNHENSKATDEDTRLALLSLDC